MKDDRFTQWLRDAWQEGMKGGDFQSLDFAALKEEGRRLLPPADRPSGPNPDPCIPALRKIH